MKAGLTEEFKKVRFFSVLSDGSTDSTNIEEELIYFLYLSRGVPKVTFLSIEDPKNVDANGLLECITTAFSRFDVNDVSKHILGLNVDGAAVNTGIHGGLGVLIKENSPWVQVIHCFNHRLEFAIKDAFKNTAFTKIDEMLNELYKLYQYSSKRLRELKRFAETWEETVPKPTKATGTRWIDHKIRAMLIVLENYGVYMQHVESLSQTDSQPKKRAELVGFVRKWKHATYPIHMALYLDVLSPIRRLSLAFQQELHDPVKAIRRIQEFTWTLAKLQLLIDASLDEPDSIMTHYKKFLSAVNVEDELGQRYTYQDVYLADYVRINGNVSTHYKESIANISSCMEQRFEAVHTSPFFKNLVPLLDVKTWPKNELGDFGDGFIQELSTSFSAILQNNNCKREKISSEWTRLKTFLIPLIANNDKSKYLEIWELVFTNELILRECRNVLDIFELLLICPFTNAKLERMFSRMNRVKTDWRNRLSRERLDNLLRIGEEGCSISDFNPDPFIDQWFSDKVRRLTAGPHQYPQKRKKAADAKDIIDLAVITLSDLESEEEEVISDEDN